LKSLSAGMDFLRPAAGEGAFAFIRRLVVWLRANTTGLHRKNQYKGEGYME
jgi:hypothetical protein